MANLTLNTDFTALIGDVQGGLTRRGDTVIMRLTRSSDTPQFVGHGQHCGV